MCIRDRSKGASLTFGEDQIFVKDPPESLKDYEGKEIVLGVRPEAFEDSVYANKKEFSEEININVSLLEDLLEKESQLNRLDMWTKLDKTDKIIKLNL